MRRNQKRYQMTKRGRIQWHLELFFFAPTTLEKYGKTRKLVIPALESTFVVKVVSESLPHLRVGGLLGLLLSPLGLLALGLLGVGGCGGRRSLGEGDGVALEGSETRGGGRGLE